MSEPEDAAIEAVRKEIIGWLDVDVAQSLTAANHVAQAAISAAKPFIIAQEKPHIEKELLGRMMEPSERMLIQAREAVGRNEPTVPDHCIGIWSEMLKQFARDLGYGDIGE